MKNFARCQGENEDEENAYRLSYSVCDIIKSIETDSDNERVRSSLQKRKNTLCNRAMNHARVSSFNSLVPHSGSLLKRAHPQPACPELFVAISAHLTTNLAIQIGLGAQLFLVDDLQL